MDNTNQPKPAYTVATSFETDNACTRLVKHGNAIAIFFDADEAHAVALALNMQTQLLATHNALVDIAAKEQVNAHRMATAIVNATATLDATGAKQRMDAVNDSEISAELWAMVMRAAGHTNGR